MVRRGYDALSLRYRAGDALPGPYAAWLAQLQTALPPRGRVLDLGCGCGVPVARTLALAGHDVLGVDVSQVQVDRARRLVPQAQFLRADVTALRLPARSYDAVVALYSLIHLPLPDQPVLLGSIADWLVDDGVLLLTAGWDAWSGSDPTWLGGSSEMRWSQADAATYATWLESAGLDVLRRERVPDGDSSHSLFWARRRPRRQPRAEPFPSARRKV